MFVVNESESSMGFPSPAADFVEPPLDLNDIIEHPLATYYVRVGKESDVSGIHPGDILVVDRALPLTSGSIVLAVMANQCILRRLRRTRDLFVLVTDTRYLPSLEVQASDIWGVVAYIIHKPRR